MCSLAHELLAFAVTFHGVTAWSSHNSFVRFFPVEEHDLFTSHGQRVAIHSQTGTVALRALLTRLAGV